MHKKYLLEATENQLKIVSLALDIFSRLESGQLNCCFDMIPWKHPENRIETRALLEKIQLLLTGMNNGNLGIGNVSDNARIAYDLHQVIRHYFAWKHKPVGGMTVDFDEPFHYGSDPLATVRE